MKRLPWGESLGLHGTVSPGTCHAGTRCFLLLQGRGRRDLQERDQRIKERKRQKLLLRQRDSGNGEKVREKYEIRKREEEKRKKVRGARQRKKVE